MDFAAQYQALLKPIFAELVRDDLADGAQAEEQARLYSERGKPEFVLAYLLVCDLPDEEKRKLFAASYERRASITVERAHEFDRKFHREFPMLLTASANDRTAAKQIRAGKLPRPGAGRHLPMK